MNRITEASSNHQQGERFPFLEKFFPLDSLQNLQKELTNIFEKFSFKEKRFIQDNILSFECFYKSRPSIAIRCFLFPNSTQKTEDEDLQLQSQWNAHIFVMSGLVDDTQAKTENKIQQKIDLSKNFGDIIINIAQKNSHSYTLCNETKKQISNIF